jgi:hypothetical protein
VPCDNFSCCLAGLLCYKQNELDSDDETEVTFSVERTFAGEHRVVELVRGGASIMVTEKNKHEYIALMTEYVAPLCDCGVTHEFECSTDPPQPNSDDAVCGGGVRCLSQQLFRIRGRSTHAIVMLNLMACLAIVCPLALFIA